MDVYLAHSRISFYPIAYDWTPSNEFLTCIFSFKTLILTLWLIFFSYKHDELSDLAADTVKSTGRIFYASCLDRDRYYDYSLCERRVGLQFRRKPVEFREISRFRRGSKVEAVWDFDEFHPNSNLNW